MKGEWKLVIAVRQDLKMGISSANYAIRFLFEIFGQVTSNEISGKGKIAAQCAHGSMKAYRMASQNARESWTFYGQPTIITEIKSEEEMGVLFKKAKELGLPACTIRDAGKTQIARGTQTVLAVGPAPCSLVDKVTGSLKLVH